MFSLNMFDYPMFSLLLSSWGGGLSDFIDSPESNFLFPFSIWVWTWDLDLGLSKSKISLT